MLGHDDAAIGSSPDEWFTRVHPDDLAAVQSRRWPRTWRAPAGTTSPSTGCCTGTATFRWFLCRGAAIRNESGTATRLAGSLTDVTDAKVADALTGLPEPRAVRRPAGPRDQADRAAPEDPLRAARVRARSLQGAQRQSRPGDGGSAARRDLAPAAGEPARDRRDHPHADTASRWPASPATSSRCSSRTSPTRATPRASAERLRAALERPFEVDGRQVFTSASAGIAVSASGYSRPEEILRDASIALQRAKTRRVPLRDLRRRRCGAAPRRGLQMETDLRQAIEDRAFEVHYQPIVEIASGRIAGVEALVRWRHPERGLVSADRLHPARGRDGDDPPARPADAWKRRAGRWPRGSSEFGADAPGRGVRQRVQPPVRGRGAGGPDRGDPA